MSIFNVDELNVKPSTLQLLHPVSGKATVTITINDVKKELRMPEFTLVSFLSPQWTKAVKETNKAATDDKTTTQLIVAECITGWNDPDHVLPPYSLDVAKQLMVTPETGWVFVQVMNHFSNLEHFFPKLSKD